MNKYRTLFLIGIVPIAAVGLLLFLLGYAAAGLGETTKRTYPDNPHPRDIMVEEIYVRDTVRVVVRDTVRIAAPCARRHSSDSTRRRISLRRDSL